MKFNLGNSGIPSTSKAGTSTRLKANNIHDVTFQGIEAEELTGKDSQTYQVLKIKFANEEGLTYEDAIFEPKEADAERRDSGFGYANPSAVEEMIFKLKHLMAAVAPAVAEQVEKKGLNVDGWEGLRKFMVTNLAKAKGTKTQIKLVADKDGNARFPGYVLGISKAGEVYPRTNFIGEKLAFTAKEIERIEKGATARPTNIAATMAADDSYLPTNTSAGDDELDLDGI